MSTDAQTDVFGRENQAVSALGKHLLEYSHPMAGNCLHSSSIPRNKNNIATQTRGKGKSLCPSDTVDNAI